jgi:DNA-binding NarL/FixJ family response regulator
MAKIRVFLTDDHTLFRQGIRTLLAAEPDIEIVGESANANDAVERAVELRPDVVLLDISMPGMSSFQAIRQMHKVRPEVKVVLLTMYDDEDYLAEGMEAGASGYVLKDSPAEHLRQAIREAHGGGSYMSPKMLAHLVNDFRSRPIGASGAAFRHPDRPREGSAEVAGRRQFSEGNRGRSGPQPENGRDPQIQPDAQAGYSQ